MRGKRLVAVAAVSVGLLVSASVTAAADPPWWSGEHRRQGHHYGWDRHKPRPRPTPTPTTSPSASPTASPTATPTATTPAGDGMPTGDLPGWRQTMAEDFSRDASAGQVRAPLYPNVADYGETSVYSPQNNSVSGGQLHMALSGTKGAVAVFGPPSTLWGWRYGKVTVRFRMPEGGLNSGAAMMLWPSSDRWGDGEVDFPEGDFAGTIHMFQHGVGCTDCGANIASVDTGESWREWHVASTEWTAGGVRYFLDGRQIAHVTEQVPINNHRHTVQLAPHNGGTDSGSLDIDWVAHYAVA